MCAYNKLHAIWCSENKFLLTDILRDTWAYDGFVVSDWGAVHNPPKAFKAGLDLQMPQNKNIEEDIRKGLENGEITMDEIDAAVGRMIKFLKQRPQSDIEYNRDEQHETARKIAAAGMVLLKNEENVLPIARGKYKKIAVVGEYAHNPLIGGQGSSEVMPHKEYVDSPYEELVKLLGDDVEINYFEGYKRGAYSGEVLWTDNREYSEFIKDADLVILFVGSMESEDTEKFDRRTAEFNPNYEIFIKRAFARGKKVVTVIQSGSAMLLDDWIEDSHSIVQMWLGGESAGGAIADVLCGLVNPSGKLPETFPTKLRTDFEFPGNKHRTEYTEKDNAVYNNVHRKICFCIYCK